MLFLSGYGKRYPELNNDFFQYGSPQRLCLRRALKIFQKGVYKMFAIKFFGGILVFCLKVLVFIFACSVIKSIVMLIYQLVKGSKLEDIKLSRWVDLVRFKIWDLIHYDKNAFPLKGIYMFSGRQGSGKTISMVEYAYRLKKKYPELLIVSNFNCSFARRMNSWEDFYKVRNGKKGVLFLIDEIQNEYSSSDSRNFPPGLLRQITMQRKQSIAIFASSQVYTRVAKPLREQCFYVIECKCFLGRYVRLRCYDADVYNDIIDTSDPEKRLKMRPIWKHKYIQSNKLRRMYDTDEVVKTLQGRQYNFDISKYM